MPILIQVLILFIMIIIGFIASKAKIAGQKAADVIAPVIIKISLPCLLIATFQQPFSKELLGEAGIAMCASLVMYGIAVPLAFVYPALLGIKGPERGVHRYAILFSNCGFLGYPVIAAILGERYIFHTIIFNIGFNFFAYSLGAWVIAKEGPEKAPLDWKTFINPCVIATITGFLLFLFSVKLPEPLYKSLKLTGDMTTPLSMLVIGINLAQVNPGQIWGKWRVYVTVCVRLFLLPLVTGLCCALAGIKGTLLALAIIIAAMPAATTTSILSSLHKAAPGEGSTLVFISTLCSMATIPLLVLILGALKLI